MPCEVVKLPSGGHAIVRTVARPPLSTCKFCGKHRATKLCDFRVKVGSIGHTRTCDAEMCDVCAHTVGPNRDYCPDHSKTEAA